MDHVVDQAVTILKTPQNRRPVHHAETARSPRRKNRPVGSRHSRRFLRRHHHGARNTSATSSRKFWKTASVFIPTYGNTLMGLAASVPLRPEDNFSITYYRARSRAPCCASSIPTKTDQLVEYGQWGRVELTTLTREFFMPRFLERDEAIRREPRAPYAWDGVAEVRPFGAMEKNIVEGVY